jgi:hypothetical protein
LHNLGYVALATGEAVRAAGLFIDSADIYVAVGTDRHGLAECLIGLACVAVRMRQNAIAARLFSVAEAELERLGAGLTPANRAEYQRGRDALHRAMKAKHYGAKELDIRSLSLEDALDQARVLLHSTPGVRRRGAVKPG